MIIAAAPSKCAPGKGRAAEKFDVMQYIRTQKYTNRMTVGTKKLWKTFVGFNNHCKNDLGWTFQRFKAEWDWLESTLPAVEKRQTKDRMSGETIAWMNVPIEDYSLGE